MKSGSSEIPSSSVRAMRAARIFPGEENSAKPSLKSISAWAILKPLVAGVNMMTLAMAPLSAVEEGDLKMAPFI